MMSNFFCFPPKASQNNGSHLKIFPPKPQKISASAARLLGCFFMSARPHWPFWVLWPVVAFLGFAGSMALHALIKCPRRNQPSIQKDAIVIKGNVIHPSKIWKKFMNYSVQKNSCVSHSLSTPMRLGVRGFQQFYAYRLRILLESYFLLQLQ